MDLELLKRNQTAVLVASGAVVLGYAAYKVMNRNTHDSKVRGYLPAPAAGKAFALDAINANFILKTLPEKEKQMLADCAESMLFEDGESLIRSGEYGDLFFIVENGTLQCFAKTAGSDEERCVENFTRGSSFGELSLLHDEPRNASIRAKGNVEMLAIHKRAFQKYVVPCMNSKKRLYLPFLRKIPMLQSLTDAHLAKIAEALVPEDFNPGENIIQEGDMGDKLYLMEQGSARVFIQGRDMGAELRQGQVFGEKALVEQAPRAATITAVSKVRALSIDAHGFFVLFLGSLEEPLRRQIASYKKVAETKTSGDDLHFVLQAVKSNFILKGLPGRQQKKLADTAFTVPFKDGETIISSGDHGDLFYIVEEGTLSCFINQDGRQKQVETFTRGASFGELALLHDEARNATVVASGPVKMKAIHKDAFDRFVKPFMEEKKAKYAPFLKNVDLLSSLGQTQLQKIAEALVPQKHKAGDYIIQQGDKGDAFYLLESGKAHASIQGKNVHSYTKGGFFGERSLVMNEPRAASIIADSDCTVYSIDSHAFFVLFLGKLGKEFQHKIEGYSAPKRARVQAE